MTPARRQVKRTVLPRLTVACEEVALHCQVDAAHIRMLAEIGRYLVALSNDANTDLNQLFAQEIAKAGDTGTCLCSCLDKLGGYRD